MRGYQMFQHDRTGRAKGGVAILMKNTILEELRRTVAFVRATGISI